MTARNKPSPAAPLFGGEPISVHAPEAPRMPDKERQLCALLRRQPLPIDRLRADPWVRRKIGVGYLESLLRYLLRDGRITVSGGVFWARPKTPPFGGPGVRPARREPFS